MMQTAIRVLRVARTNVASSQYVGTRHRASSSIVCGLGTTRRRECILESARVGGVIKATPNIVNNSRTTPPAQRLSSRVFAAARDTQDETDTPVSVTEETEGDDYVKRISITSNDYPEVTILGEIGLPDPENARVKSAEYVSSAVRLDQLPKAKLGETKRPEIAVIGRSNVGKSSLINMLTRKAGLAMVSKTPGKTRTINHFNINDSWYLVDLPGYGFAKSGKKIRMEWFGFTKEYFLERDQLVMVLLLVDASIPPQQADVECLNWLADAEVPVSVVFTKMDKKKKKCPKNSENILAFEREMHEIFEHMPPRVATSSASGVGKDGLLRYLARLRNLAEQTAVVPSLPFLDI